MSSPWQFVPNIAADIWFAPSDPVTDPPDNSGLDCQQLKPFYQVRGLLPPVMIHRLIFKLADIGNVGSTQLKDGIWIRLVDALGNNIGWYQANDSSPFGFNDPIDGYTIEVVMWACSLANF